jgi:hypothetical protein
MRRAIAGRLQMSKQHAPHFRLTVDLDLERLLALRKEINSEVPGVKISVNDMLVKACAMALIAVPDVNIQFDEATQSIRRFADDTRGRCAARRVNYPYRTFGQQQVDKRHIKRSSFSDNQSPGGHAQARRIPGRHL